MSLRFRMKWVLHSAAVFLAAALALLFALRVALNRSLGHDYARGFWTLNELESSLRLAVGVPLLLYVVLVSVCVAAIKIFISHRIAGPILRLERCAAAFAVGDFSFVTRLRRGDELKGLAQSVDTLRDHAVGQVDAALVGAGRVRTVLDEIGGLDEAAFRRDADRHLARLEEELVALDRRLRPVCDPMSPPSAPEAAVAVRA